MNKTLVEEKIRPWLLYPMVHPPGTSREGKEYFIFIFQAWLKRVPGKIDEKEIGGLITLSFQQVLDSIAGKQKWSELKKGGDRVVAGRKEPGEDTVLYPLGTALALATILNRLKR